MKKFSLLFLFACFAMGTRAQDTIIRNNADIVVAKILEISPTEVKYKRFEFQDGPLYTELKSNIKMIIYSNGVKEHFGPEKPVALKNRPVNRTVDNHIDDYLGVYSYQGMGIDERRLHAVLLSTQNKKIMSLVAEAKDAHRLQYIGFAAIPFGIVALYSTAGFGSYRTTTRNGFMAAGILGLAGTISFPIISKINKQKRLDANSAAIALYNQEY
jgi:hypothetical protein